MSRRALGLVAATAGAATIVAAFLPWWRLPSEQVFGLGIPGYEVTGVERWHGWAAGAAGIALVVLGGAVAVRPLVPRAIAIMALAVAVALIGVVGAALLASGEALRAGTGAILAGASGLVATAASAAAHRRPRDTSRAWVGDTR